jgi:hypothetical protein
MRAIRETCSNHSSTGADGTEAPLDLDALTRWALRKQSKGRLTQPFLVGLEGKRNRRPPIRHHQPLTKQNTSRLSLSRSGPPNWPKLLICSAWEIHDEILPVI